jgi:translation initiation factor 1
MKKKAKPNNNTNGIVFSTDPSFSMANEETSIETLPEAQQKLTIKLDTRQRAGKAVTLVQGFMGKQEDLEELGKKLKNFCGSGGSVKEGEIIVQGDHRDKILPWLQKNGYVKARRL